MSITTFERSFTRYIFKNTGGFLPSWPLGRHIRLGDIIDLKRNRMEYLGNLGEEAFGIKLGTIEDPNEDSFKWQSKSNVNISIKAKGAAPVPGSNIPIDKAGITIEFTKSGGFIFQPLGLKYNKLKNLVSVRQDAMKKLAVELFGMRKIYFIKEVANVKSYALTISQSSDSKLELAVEGKVSVSAKDLANVDLDFQVKTEKFLDFSVTGTKGGSIFFKPERMKLKREKREEIVETHPKLNAFSDENLIAMIPPRDITADTINNIMEFAPVTLEDLDDILEVEDSVV